MAGDVGVGVGDPVAVIGTFQGDVSVGSETACAASRGTDVFVVGLERGNAGVAWTWCFGSAQSDDGVAVAIDADRDVLVAGAFGRPDGTPIDLGGGDIAAPSGGGVFVAKLSGADGAHIWSVGIGRPALPA